MKRFKTAIQYLANLEKIDHLLDAGTGIGFFLPTLISAADQVSAIDNTDFSLKYAKSMIEKRGLKGITFKKAYLKKLPFKKNQFEVVVCMSVLEHILPENLNQVTREFKRVLKPNGLLIAGFPNEGSILFKVLQKTERVMFRRQAFKAFEKEDRGKHQTLGHVSTAQQITKVIKSNYKMLEYDSLPFWGLKLYCMGLFKNN